MDDRQHVVLSGRIDTRTAPTVRDHLLQAIDDGVGDLAVDLSDADIADLTGLAVLVGAYDRARRAERHLVVEAMSPRVARLLRRSRLERLLVPGAADHAHRRRVAAITA